MAQETKKPKRDNAVCGMDFTLPWEAPIGPKELVHCLEKRFKSFVFQLEQGAGGYKHWQGRGSLKIRDRPASLKIKMLGGCLDKAHFSISSTPTFKNDDFDYVMKEEGRLSGPYKDGMFPPMPRILQRIVALYPWQQAVVDECKVECTDDRSINVIYDPATGIGKSMLIAFLRFHGIACVVPPFDKFEDMAAMVLAKGQQQAFVFDLPKEIDKKVASSFWKGVEMVKNGYAFDKRYKFRDAVFDTTHIWIMTNNMPPMKCMSEDRWKIYMVDWNHKLVFWNKTREENIMAAIKEDREVLINSQLKRSASTQEESDQPRKKAKHL